MTAYNREAYLREAASSVLESTFEDLELVIVDDCSADGTKEVAWAIATRDKRVRVFENDENLGDYPNRNRAASLARGKYLKYLDADDQIYPHGIAVMVAAMERYPRAGFGLSARPDVLRPCPQLLDPNESYKKHFFGGDLFGRAPGSSLIRRDAFTRVGGFSGRRQIGDYEFWLTLARESSLVTFPRDLYWAATHDKQEQRRDSLVDKIVMRYRVELAALAHRACPLSAADVVLARQYLARAHARAFWTLLLRRRLLEALALQRQVDLGWLELLRIR